MRLHLLGRFQVLGPDGEPVELVSRKAQALLAYLAAEPGRPHAREHLATLLWADTGEERARHNLRQALSKIRRTLGEIVTAGQDTLALDPSACRVDVAELEEIAGSDDPEELRRGVSLYRGDLLEGLNPREAAFEEWLTPARVRLKRLACDVAEKLVSTLEARDRIPEAIEAMDQRLLMDPACEPAHRMMMEMLDRAGRRSDALRQYRTCAEALRRDLGAEPGPETEAVRERIRKGVPRGDAGPPVPAAGSAPAPAPDRPTIAVLPFRNMSGPDDGYFVDGIVEEIITCLCRFSSLQVIARSSSFAFRDRDVSDREIASSLGAQYLVRGSVQKAGRRVRINVQLLDPEAGLNLWGGRFDREMEDVFILQDEIASTVVSTLAGRVEAARLARARRAPAERLAAYDFFLRGKEHHHRYTAEDCLKCIEMFQEAIQRDPDYATAHGWLACGFGQAMAFQPENIARLMARSKAAAERGLELDENDSECHRILAQVSLVRRNHKRALHHQERALFLNPNDDRCVCAMGEILAFMGRALEAEDWVRKAMRLNPYHPDRYWTHLGRALLHQERYDEALAALERVVKPRRDDLVYRLAAANRLGETRASGAARTELEQGPDGLDGEAMVGSMPYEREEDRRFLIDALELGRDG